jgi:hypothetical protein
LILAFLSWLFSMHCHWKVWKWFYVLQKILMN